MMMIQIYLVLLLNVIEHGDDVHSEQQPVPSELVHVTCSADDGIDGTNLVVGLRVGIVGAAVVRAMIRLGLGIVVVVVVVIVGL